MGRVGRRRGAPLNDADAPSPYVDPTDDIEPWQLTPAGQRIYEAGFLYLIRT